MKSEGWLKLKFLNYLRSTKKSTTNIWIFSYPHTTDNYYSAGSVLLCSTPTDCAPTLLDPSMKSAKMNFPPVFKDKSDYSNQFDDDLNLRPVKRNLYWSKRSSKQDDLSLPIPPSKRDLYWSKRSQQFPTLPFSTIVRNGNPKRRTYWDSE